MSQLKDALKDFRFEITMCEFARWHIYYILIISFNILETFEIPTESEILFEGNCQCHLKRGQSFNFLKTI